MLHYDFCPQANRWVYWLKNPFWCLILAIGLSAVCGLFVNSSAFLITTLLVMLSAVGILIPLLTVRGLDCDVMFDQRRGRVGVPSTVRLRIRNRRPWPALGLSLIRGFALRPTHESTEGVSLARVPAWSEVEYSWPFVPQCRGVYPLSEPGIETGFPFGILRFTRQVRVHGTLIVWPETDVLRGLPDTLEHGGNERLADRKAGDFGDMLGTRLFRDGDSLRRVHWAQTARQRQLIVCERQAPETSSVLVYADCARASHPEWNPERRDFADAFERFIRTVASLCESLHRQQCRVSLVIGEQKVDAGASAVTFQAMMDRLAEAMPEDEATLSGAATLRGGFQIAVTTPAGLRWRKSQFRGMHVVLISPASSSEASRVKHSDAWIELNGSDDSGPQLVAAWRGACNVR